MSDIMSVTELAEYLKVSKGTIYKLKDEKKIPFIEVGNSIRFRKADIEEWLNKQLGGTKA